METRAALSEVDSEVDIEISKFLDDIYTSVQNWKKFYFPLKEHGYVNFNTQTFKKFGFRFLDRILFTSADGKQHRGTVIGEHEDSLYINLDTHFYAQAVDKDKHQQLPIAKDNSGQTEFPSVQAFEHKYLGFYLITHCRHKELLENKKRNKFKNHFWANMRRNEAYINNTLLLEKTLPRIRLPRK